MYGIKRSRFRLTDEERVRTLLEFYNLIREEITTSEEELWEKLHEILNQGNPVRFKLCSIRNLKRNVTDQVAKFKRINSDETAVYEKERLNVKYFGSSWSDAMKKIMPVWHNYENLVQMELVKKSVNYVKRKKDRHDSETSKKFCDSSFPDITEEEEHSSEIFIEIPQDEEPSFENFHSTESLFSSVSSPDLRLSNFDDYRKCHVKFVWKMQNNLGSTDPGFKHYMEIKRQELEIKKAKFKMQEKVAMEELELRKKQLELDVSRFEAEVEDRKSLREAQQEEREAQRQERKVIREEREMHYKTIQATTALLTAVLQSGILKK